MTDRYAGYTVTMEQDMRSDDAEATLNALRQIKGVLSVVPVVSSPEVHFGRERAKYEMVSLVLKTLEKS